VQNRGRLLNLLDAHQSQHQQQQQQWVACWVGKQMKLSRAQPLEVAAAAEQLVDGCDPVVVQAITSRGISSCENTYSSNAAKAACRSCTGARWHQCSRGDCVVPY